MKTIIINNAGPRGPQGPDGPQGPQGPSGSDANVPALIISSSKQFTDITSPFTGSFTGSFAGDGSNLINVPASGVVGLNLSRISSGTATASISETTGFFVNTHITASGDISASGATITALTGSFNHIITDDETLEFRSKSAGTKVGQLKFNTVNGLEIQDPGGARAKIRAARGEFLSLEAGPVGMNSLGSITASNDISASGKFIGDGSGLTNVFENTTASSSLSTRVTANESAITTLNTSGLISSSRQIANNISGSLGSNAVLIRSLDAAVISGSFTAPSASIAQDIIANKDLIDSNTGNISINDSNISSNRSLITGITSSLSTTGRMVFVGANGILTSEAGFEYNATTNQLSVDNLNVNHLTSSFITSSRIFTSGSNIFGDASNDVQTLIGTTKMSGSAQVTGSLNTSGIITGDGSGLTNIPASGIVGLNLSQIASGSATASISPDKGLVINTDTKITGSLLVSGSSVEFKSSGGTVFSIAETGSFTLGEGATNSSDTNVVIGRNAIAAGAFNIAMGNAADNDGGSYNIAIGSGANTTNTSFGIAIGGSTYGKSRTIVLGHSSAGGTGTIAIGDDAGSDQGDYNILLGFHAGKSTTGDSNIIIGSGSLGGGISNQLRIGHAGVTVISGSLTTGDILLQGDVSSSVASTASFGTYVGDGSQLSGISTTPFPFSGSAVITGSLTVSGSVVDFMSASAINLDIEKIPLVNPMVEYFDVGAITGSGTTITLPNSLTYVSSSVYEYLEVFVNGLRLRYNRDFVPMSDTSIKYNITIVSGSEVTYKSLKRP